MKNYRYTTCPVRTDSSQAKAIFRLFTAKKVNKSHVDEITNGVSLNKEGKELLVNALLDYLEGDSIRYRGRNQTRANAMQQEAHVFANELIEKDVEPDSIEL